MNVDSADSADSDADPVWGVRKPAATNGANWSANRAHSSPPAYEKLFAAPPEEVRRSFEPPPSPPPPDALETSATPAGSKTHIRPPPCVVHACTTSARCAHETSPLPNRTCPDRTGNGAADENARASSSGANPTPRASNTTAGPWNSASLGSRSERAAYVAQSRVTRTLDAPAASASSKRSQRKNDESSYRGRSLRRVRGSGHARRDVDRESTAYISRRDLEPKRSAAACETEACTSRKAPTPAAAEEGVFFLRRTSFASPSPPSSFSPSSPSSSSSSSPRSHSASFRASSRAGAMTPRRSGRKNAPDASVVASPRSRRDAAQHSASDAASASRSGESPPPPVGVLVPVLLAFESSAPDAFESFARRFAASKKSIGSNASRTPSASRSAPRLASSAGTP